jgi:hypothetical protein
MQKLEALYLKPTTDFTKLFECSVVISMVSDDDAAREIVFGRSDSGSSASPRFNARRNPSFDEHNQHGDRVTACERARGTDRATLQRQFWESYCREARQLFIIASGASVMSKSAAATRGDWAADLRDRNQPTDANFQTAWQHDDGDRTGDAWRSVAVIESAALIRSIHGPYDEYILRRTRRHRIYGDKLPDKTMSQDSHPLALKDVRLALTEAECRSSVTIAKRVRRMITGLRRLRRTDWTALGLVAAEEAGIHAAPTVATNFTGSQPTMLTQGMKSRQARLKLIETNMEYADIPGTGLKVSRVAIGTAIGGWMWAER